MSVNCPGNNRTAVPAMVLKGATSPCLERPSKTSSMAVAGRSCSGATRCNLPPNTHQTTETAVAPRPKDGSCDNTRPGPYHRPDWPGPRP
eukprot:1922798-Lingulodinium_polyedra.AAC.1